MATTPATIRWVELSTIDETKYSAHLADCVVLTQDGKLLMQQRTASWGNYAGNLNTFGGHVEAGETPLQGLIRELNEELGAIVLAQDVVKIGGITEDFTNHQELVHIHFWHDKQGTITGCYEAEPRTYDSVAQALAHPKIMDYAAAALIRCQAMGLLPGL